MTKGIKYARPQAAYIIAKARLEALREQRKAWDRSWLEENGLGDLDCPYAIEDNDVFDTWCEAASEHDKSIGLCEAEETMQQAEKALIEWGMDKAKAGLPAEIVHKLERGLKQYKIRQEFIQITLRVQM